MGQLDRRKNLSARGRSVVAFTLLVVPWLFAPAAAQAADQSVTSIPDTPSEVADGGFAQDVPLSGPQVDVGIGGTDGRIGGGTGGAGGESGGSGGSVQ
jgi:hypothetical protein